MEEPREPVCRILDMLTQLDAQLRGDAARELIAQVEFVNQRVKTWARAGERAPLCLR